jgi:hypothetical protein
MSLRLTENQRDVLQGLYDAGDGWLRPMDFGARDASHHSGTATRLCKRGLVERSDAFTGSISGRRKVWLYRITPAGLDALQNAAPAGVGAEGPKTGSTR